MLGSGRRLDYNGSAMVPGNHCDIMTVVRGFWMKTPSVLAGLINRCFAPPMTLAECLTAWYGGPTEQPL